MSERGEGREATLSPSTQVATPDASGRPRPRHAPAAGKRRQAREMALQMLYQWEQGGSHLNEIFRSFDLHLYGAETSSGETAKDSPSAFEQARVLVRGTVAAVGEIDRHISLQAENWRLERMPMVDRNILRMAVFELLNERDVPAAVVIDEAIELAKKFGTERSGAFVNGLLDGLVRRLQQGSAEAVSD